MRTARDLMEAPRVTFARATPVADVARQLLEADLDGAPVVEDVRVVGVVTTMDLVFQERKVHLPTFITFLDAMIPLGVNRTRHELEKIAGMKAEDIMSTPPYTVGPDVTVDVIAADMVDHHYSVVPVLEDDRLVGVVTKQAILRAALAARLR